tara:strand:+ start:203 stop:367 length:165 start_codon:yes stop_codon:yes gene_type:complete
MDWDDAIIFKEIAFVYIVNGKKFLDEKEAEEYLLRRKDAEQKSKRKKERKKKKK